MGILILECARLVVEVFGYLPKSDLKSARLTCTRYGQIGAQWLFQRLYFAPRRAPIEIFLNICANPTFARTVTELVYDARLLVGYPRLDDQQESIFEGQKDHEALWTGLKNLPNITVVSAFDPGDDRPKKSDVRGIQSLIRAVSTCCHKLKELHVGSVSSRAPMTVFGMNEDLHEKACVMAASLTTLKMGLYKSHSNSVDECKEQYDRLDQFLSQAKELQCLAISGDIGLRLFKDKVWPHLEALEWANMGFDAADLKAITQAHKGTLRKLTILNVFMYGKERWADAAKEIGKYLRLRCVSVSNLCEYATEGGGRGGRGELESPYISDEAHWAVACRFTQSIRGMILSEDGAGCYTITACP